MRESAILDQYGRPAKKPERKLVATATQWGSRTVESSLTGINLTPSEIRQYLLDAETGDISAQCELFEQMERRDSLLDTHLRTRKNAVASLAHEILPADDSPEADAMAEYAREVVAGIAGLRESIFDVLDAIGKGVAVLEIEWLTTKSEWTPARLHYRPQRWFTLAADGMTLMLKGESFGDDIELNPLSFIIHRAQARSGFLWNWSLLKSCARPFVMRQYGVKDWLAFAEVYGMPPRIGHLREGVDWNSDEARQLYAAVQAMGIDMAAVVREGNVIEVLNTAAAGEGQIFERLMDHADREMTKAILGQTLTSGGEGGGSYALGKVHNEVRGDLTETDALGMDETMTQQLLAPIIHLNKGPNAPVPLWHTAFQEPEDLPQLATTYKTLAEAGFPIPHSHVQLKFNIPEPQGDEPVLVPPTAGFGGGAFANVPGATRTHVAVGDHAAAGRGRYVALNDPRFRRQARLLRCAAEDLALRLNAQMTDWRVIDETAMSFLAEKRIATQATWEALSPAGRQRAWWVTGLAEENTALVASELTEVLREGETENQFLERLENLGLSVTEAAEAGAGQIPAWQARLVHRNNRWAAQNAGQYIRLQRDADVRPYGQWVCHTPCDICAPLCGNVAPLGGTFFASYWPQIHHACQCEVVSLSQMDIDDENLGGVLAETDPAPLDAPPQFLRHPGDAYYLEAEGGAPATDAGRADAEILGGLAHVAGYI